MLVSFIIRTNVKDSFCMSNVIYLDYQATTPTDQKVVDQMLPYFTQHFGNPHSRNHSYGWKAEEAVEKSRAQVASLIGAGPKEIVFTSGATEANNLALKGLARFYGDQKKHIITCVTEHKAVIDTTRHLEQEGFSVTYLPVNPNGLINLTDLENAITDQTLVVSIMAINSEIGVIQPIKKIGQICRQKGVFFHTDAAQAAGKVPLDVDDMNIDLLSISGHKLYGPKGIGALYVRRRPRVRLQALMNGGNQERGMRSGTLPTPLCVGLGAACALAQETMTEETKRIESLGKYLHKKLTDNLEHIYLNGDDQHRFYGNLNISFAYVEGESLIVALQDIAVSSGSACTSASLEPSYVLRALGVDEELAHTSLRLGIGRYTTQAEVDHVADKIIHHVIRLREMSPLYEMVQEGIDLKTIEWTGH
jgi:cysteine desulfurase